MRYRIRIQWSDTIKKIRNLNQQTLARAIKNGQYAVEQSMVTTQTTVINLITNPSGPKKTETPTIVNKVRAPAGKETTIRQINLLLKTPRLPIPILQPIRLHSSAHRWRLLTLPAIIP